ncbi:hypothetical protein [Streptomyces sp. NPDC008092]
MSKRALTTESGAPVTDDQNSAGGPPLAGRCTAEAVRAPRAD